MIVALVTGRRDPWTHEASPRRGTKPTLDPMTEAPSLRLAGVHDFAVTFPAVAGAD